MRNLRLWAYVALALALLSLALFAPHAWATPDNQGTVPGPTRPKPVTPTSIVPTLAPAPPSRPRPAPQPSTDVEQPTANPTLQPEASPTPGQTPAATALPGITEALKLSLVAVPPVVWPGATIHFTATLGNHGSEPIVGIVMTQTLSSGLVPGRLPAGSPARWEGQALHVVIPALGPGERFVLTFSANVSPSAARGSVLQTVGVATGFGGVQAWLQTLLPLPPKELPRTGGPWHRNP